MKEVARTHQPEDQEARGFQMVVRTADEKARDVSIEDVLRQEEVWSFPLVWNLGHNLEEAKKRPFLICLSARKDL